VAALGCLAAALIGVILYALHLGRHVKIGFKIPLATFFFETESQNVRPKK
jgi:hypothetical protein